MKKLKKKTIFSLCSVIYFAKELINKLKKLRLILKFKKNHQKMKIEIKKKYLINYVY